MQRPTFFSKYTQFCIENKYIQRLSRKVFDNTLEMMMSRSRNKKGYCWKFEKDVLKKYLVDNEYWVEPDACLIDDDD